MFRQLGALDAFLFNFSNEKKEEWNLLENW